MDEDFNEDGSWTEGTDFGVEPWEWDNPEKPPAETLKD